MLAYKNLYFIANNSIFLYICIQLGKLTMFRFFCKPSENTFNLDSSTNYEKIFYHVARLFYGPSIRSFTDV